MNWEGFGSVYHLPSILSLHLATSWKEVKWDSLWFKTLKDFSPLWEGLFVFPVKSCSPFFWHLIMFAGQKGWWIFRVEWNTWITDYLLSCLYCPHIPAFGTWSSLVICRTSIKQNNTLGTISTRTPLSTCTTLYVYSCIMENRIDCVTLLETIETSVKPFHRWLTLLSKCTFVVQHFQYSLYS